MNLWAMECLIGVGGWVVGPRSSMYTRHVYMFVYKTKALWRNKQASLTQFYLLINAFILGKRARQC